MRKLSFTSLVFILVTFFVVQLSAQTFGAGIHLGFNASQIDGDDSYGFNRLGLAAGISGIIHITERSGIATEILFSQRGSRNKLLPDNANVVGGVGLNYVEVPVYYTIDDWKVTDDDENDFYKMQFGVGLSYGRLMNHKIENDFINTEVANLFNKNDISWLLQGSFRWSNHWSASVRFTSGRWISKLFDADKNRISINSKDLLSYFFTFRLNYLF
ncbi:MAG: PorT family protein [Saprospiraceae bacterium]|nr:PorT family protein [Saprospiraceae bacterium]MBP7699129.1 PorT family protein [Saprospiraceae bacterium]